VPRKIPGYKKGVFPPQGVFCNGGWGLHPKKEWGIFVWRHKISGKNLWAGAFSPGNLLLEISGRAGQHFFFPEDTGYVGFNREYLACPQRVLTWGPRHY